MGRALGRPQSVLCQQRAPCAQRGRGVTACHLPQALVDSGGHALGFDMHLPLVSC